MTTEEFIARIQDSGALATPGDAERWAAAVLVALSHLLPDSETRRHFVSQLPGRLKARLLEEPPRSLQMDRDAFLQHLARALGTHAPGAEAALRAVYGVLRQAVSAGGIADFEAHIPKDIAGLLERGA